MPRAFETVLEIDLNAVAHNYTYITSKLNKDTKVLAVVKAFGYGSDAALVAKKLVELGVDYFAVAYAHEGAALRDAGICTPILVLHPLPTSFEMILERCLEPNLYSEKMLTEFISFAEEKGQKEYPIHIKFNTGLNRLGFQEKDVASVAHLVSESNSVKIRSVLSHLAASEDATERAFTESQLMAFEKISEEISESIGYTPIRHTLNTSGVLNYPEAQFDMVRTGIGLYGFSNDTQETKNLIPVSTLKTVISQIHTIDVGQSVGYNRALRATKPMKTATLPIGHADGISRAFGNGVGWATINGKKAPIAGNVCMDMIMVDVSNISCAEGDEVIIFGKTPTAESLANAIDTIPYELLTAISQRIKRIVIS